MILFIQCGNGDMKVWLGSFTKNDRACKHCQLNGVFVTLLPRSSSRLVYLHPDSSTASRSLVLETPLIPPGSFYNWGILRLCRQYIYCPSSDPKSVVYIAFDCTNLSFENHVVTDWNVCMSVFIWIVGHYYIISVCNHCHGVKHLIQISFMWRVMLYNT